MHEATVLPKWQISLGLRNQSEPQIRAEEMFVSGLVSAGDKQATSTLDIREERSHSFSDSRLDSSNILCNNMVAFVERIWAVGAFSMT